MIQLPDRIEDLSARMDLLSSRLVDVKTEVDEDDQVATKVEASMQAAQRKAEEQSKKADRKVARISKRVKAIDEKVRAADKIECLMKALLPADKLNGKATFVQQQTADGVPADLQKQ